MLSEFALSRINAVEGINDYYTAFYIDWTNKICEVSNPYALPKWCTESDKTFIDALNDNVERLHPDDMGLFKAVLRYLSRPIKRNRLRGKKPLEFSIRIATEIEGKYDTYHITVFASVNVITSSTELIGHIYRNVKKFGVYKNQLGDLLEDYIFEISKSEFWYNWAIVQCDINNFKAINMVHGVDFATKILEYVESVISLYMSGEHCRIRRVNDVFTLVVRFQTLEELCKDIKCVDETISVYGGISYSVSWGIYVISDFNLPPRIMFDSAMLARKCVKGSLGNNIEIYQPKYRKDIISGFEQEQSIQPALSNHEFKLFMQPKYNIVTKQIVGAEALVRWIKPDGSQIYPDEFISLFESNGFITKLDYYIWDEAVRKLKEWEKAGLVCVPISMNVSRLHLRDLAFLDYIDSLCEKYGVSKEYVELEITESLNIGAITSVVDKIKERGYKLLMDDFGTGVSSLATLNDTNFDVIKIDKSLLPESINNVDGYKILMWITNMLKDMGLDIVVEGVETLEQVNLLIELGCDVIQGYYISKPLPVDDFAQIYLNERK